MKEKILLQLKAYLVTLGVKNLSNDRMNAIADRLIKKFPDLKEEEIDAKLADYHDLNPLDEMAKQDDKLRTLESKTKEKPKEKPKEKGKSEDDDEEENNEGKGGNLAKKFNELSEQVAELKKEKAQAKLQDAFHVKLKELNIPVAFAKGRSIESEDKLEEIVTEVENDWTEVKQSFADGKLSQTTPPLGGKGGSVSKKASEEETKAVLDTIM